MMGVYIHKVELYQRDIESRLKGTITRRHNDRNIFFRAKQAHNGIASQQPIIKILVTIMRIVTAEYNVSVMEINDEFNTNT